MRDTKMVDRELMCQILCDVELQTKVMQRFRRFHNHGEGPTICVTMIIGNYAAKISIHKKFVLKLSAQLNRIDNDHDYDLVY